MLDPQRDLAGRRDAEGWAAEWLLARSRTGSRNDKKIAKISLESLKGHKRKNATRSSMSGVARNTTVTSGNELAERGEKTRVFKLVLMKHGL